MNYSPAIQNLINKIAKLPSIGPKTAERLVFYLLRQKTLLSEIAEAMEGVKGKIYNCSRCFNFAESVICPICSDPQRSAKIICVVAKPQDISAIEKTNSFKGLYHLLGGNINPTENELSDLKLKELIHRLERDDVQEVILALNPDMEGETTIMYLAKLIKKYRPVKLTRLARGLPMGADVEYADEATLENALQYRKEL